METTVRILQLSDIHFPDRNEELPVPGLTTTAYLEQLATAVRDISSDIIVVSGDLSLNATSEYAYAALGELFEKAGRPVYVIPGNHDIGGSPGDFFPPPGRVVSRGPEHCFTVSIAEHQLRFLDSSPGVVDEAALRWLREEISGSTSRAFVFMHHPPLLAGAPFMDHNFPLQNHAEVLAVLEACTSGVAVFCGHYHCARDLFRGAVAVHIAPSTLFQLDPEADEFVLLSSPPACRLIELEGDDYRTWVRALELGPAHT